MADQDARPPAAPEWTKADELHLRHLSKCADPQWMGEVATRALAAITALHSQVAALSEERDALAKYAREVEAERLTMAKLSADTPQFSNPLIAWAAQERRDEILRGEHLRTVDSITSRAARQESPR